MGLIHIKLIMGVNLYPLGFKGVDVASLISLPPFSLCVKILTTRELATTATKTPNSSGRTSSDNCDKNRSHQLVAIVDTTETITCRQHHQQLESSVLHTTVISSCRIAAATSTPLYAPCFLKWALSRALSLVGCSNGELMIIKVLLLLLSMLLCSFFFLHIFMICPHLNFKGSGWVAIRGAFLICLWLWDCQRRANLCYFACIDLILLFTNDCGFMVD